MPNSYAQNAQLTCPVCGQPFAADIWLIVDVDERPDLAAAARAGDLHAVTCPRCGSQGAVDAPLLLYLPHADPAIGQPPLIFSPAQQTSAEQDQQMAGGLLQMLAQRLGDAWQDAWLGEIATVQRELLPVALSDDPAAAMAEFSAQRRGDAEEEIEGQEIEDLPDLINRFLAAITWDESQQIVEAHPELLRDEVDERFGLALEEYADNPDAVAMLTTYRSLLRRCRAVGIARAFAEQMLPPEALAEAERLGLVPEVFLAHMRAVEEMPPALREVLAELAAAGVEVRSPEDLERALAARPDLRAKLEAGVQRSGAGGLYVSPEVQSLIDELGRLTRRTDMPRRIELYRQALLLVERAANPRLWATLQGGLGNGYAQTLQGDRAENIERAIDGYQQALQVMTRQAMPVEWATTMMNLAAAYNSRIRGEKAENIERAIDGYQQALQVLTRQAMPVEWATTMMNLASAYRDRIRGDKAENTERAIDGYQQALQAITCHAMPVAWAHTMMNLATAYRDRIRGDKAENIERAIDGYQHALQVMTRQAMPVEWAEATTNLATAYINRIRGDKAENIERAIDGYQQALQVLTRQAMPVKWAQTTMNLATAYHSRIRGDKAENIERAIDGFQQALQVLTRQAMPVEWATTMMNLATAYHSRIRGDKAENIERAIDGFQQALQVRTRQAMPVAWAHTMMNLATSYSDRIRGDKAENIERAIGGYQQALQVRTRQAMPVEWAEATMNLANAYRDRIRGDEAENIERAIDGYQQALQVMTRQAMPVAWAQTQNNLAIAYSNRIRGEKAENIERAIEGYQQVLQVRTRQAMPVEWATTMMNLATACGNRIRGEKAENIERAIEGYQQALQVMTRQAMPIDWAQTMMNLANAYGNRIRGEKAENIERAIEGYQQALQVRTRQAMPVEWAEATMNLANAYKNRIRGDEAENIERAIEGYQQALQVRTRQAMPVEWATTMMNLANAYNSRIRGENAENIERAIDGYQQALQVLTRQAMPVEWATTMMNLASAYAGRIRGERAENIERAIEGYQQALQVRTRQAMPVAWAHTMMNLATSYSDRIRGDKAENIERAIGGYQQALQVRTRQAMPVEWAEATMNLANAYRDRIRGDEAENIERAIEGYQQALQVMTRQAMPADYLAVHRALGRVLFEQGRLSASLTHDQAVLATAEDLYTAAPTPEARRAILQEVGATPQRLAFALCRTDGAVGSQQAVVVLEQNRARWLREALAMSTARPAGVPEHLWADYQAQAQAVRELTAEAQLPDHTPGRRSFLALSELLGAARTALGAAVAAIRAVAPDFLPQPSFSQIQAAAQDGPLVYIAATAAGGLALIVRGQDHKPGFWEKPGLSAAAVTAVWLDDLTDARVREWLYGPADDPELGGWLGAYQGWLQALQQAQQFRPLPRDDARRQAAAAAEAAARTHWHAVLDATLQEVWNAAMAPLTTPLANPPIPQSLNLPIPQSPIPQSPNLQSPLTLIPTGLLGLLPLHAAWRTDPAAPTGRRYFLDDYVVRYAPSATALGHAAQAAATAAAERLLAIDEPAVTGAGRLPNSAREVAAVAGHFTDPTLLAHAAATRPAVLAQLAEAQVAHFSCHGANNWQEPLASGLLMAGGERLTVADVLELRLGGARLATLSACETGIPGASLPDEAVMLPSALLQAGYAGVAASLWTVSDVSTAMLMAYFYKLWRDDGIDPPAALVLAQRWLRDSSNGEKQAFFAGYAPELAGELRMGQSVAVEFFTAVRLSGVEAERSFAHPYWWSAFYFTGA